jgi:hypothetical protein
LATEGQGTSASPHAHACSCLLVQIKRPARGSASPTNPKLLIVHGFERNEGTVGGRFVGCGSMERPAPTAIVSRTCENKPCRINSLLAFALVVEPSRHLPESELSLLDNSRKRRAAGVCGLVYRFGYALHLYLLALQSSGCWTLRVNDNSDLTPQSSINFLCAVEEF